MTITGVCDSRSHVDGDAYLSKLPQRAVPKTRRGGTGGVVNFIKKYLTAFAIVLFLWCVGWGGWILRFFFSR